MSNYALTWQGQRDSHIPMESNAQTSNGARHRPFIVEGEPVELANPSGRLPYHHHQLQPKPDYKGIIDCWSDDEARSIFVELFARFDVLPWDGIQLPPTGLPGFAVKAYDRDDPEAELLLLGMRYLKAIVFSEGRAMHLRWQDAGDFIRKIRREAADKESDAIYARWAEDEAAAAARVKPQLVYFIGAASGPIKIGIATNPKGRLSGLQTSHHERLELLATCEGGLGQERAYHKQFASRRLSGEWFERCPEIEEEIERLSNG